MNLVNTQHKRPRVSWGLRGGNTEVLTESGGWVCSWRFWPFKGCGLAIAFSLTSVITLAMQRTVTVGKRGSNLPQMTMPSTIYQSTQYHSCPVKTNVMMFTDLCSSDVCTTEEEAGSPWRCWAGDRTVSGGVRAELLRCTSGTVLPTVAWSSLSSTIKYESMQTF